MYLKKKTIEGKKIKEGKGKERKREEKRKQVGSPVHVREWNQKCSAGSTPVMKKTIPLESCCTHIGVPGVV